MNDTKAAFVTSATSFASVVSTVRDEQWNAPGLGEWDVRELVGHALRGVTTAPTYLEAAGPSSGITLATAGDYVRAAFSTAGVHASVAQRGREAGAALGDDPAGAVRAAVDAAVATVSAASPDAVVATPFGTMRLDTYLPTRIVELVVHTDDLCRAVGHGPVATATELRIVLGVLAESADPASGLLIVRALLGRVDLPAGFNLWA
ncbi:MAG TPA: maleylpyruvate isomerase N-terminal domain-containing protein [Microthrixaceae bacterium]|nr:maleylpyruvate isomerase N-terminal domain-containing protein [Microthrixaceae bacterium]